jgi:biotin carboxyl carrier protein
MRYQVNAGTGTYRLELERSEKNWLCRLDGREVPVNVVQTGPGTLSLLVEGRSFEVRREGNSDAARIFVGATPYAVSVQDPRSLRSRHRTGAGQQGPQALTASMPGKVVRLLAREGEQVREGQGILVVEAMKMQNEIRSPREGKIVKLRAREGLNVNAGETLAIIE